MRAALASMCSDRPIWRGQRDDAVRRPRPARDIPPAELETAHYRQNTGLAEAG